MQPAKPKTRIVILGGGFAGVYVARRLEKLLAADQADVTLISRHNYLLITPLLFEAGSGVLEPRHTVNPLRPLFKMVRFIEAEVEHIDVEGRKVVANPAHEERVEVPYDQLVLALGGVTNRSLVPGADAAFAFKTLGDAIVLRNHVIRCCERADVEQDPQRKRSLLSFVIVGGGLVAVELAGELTVFLRNLLKSYSNIRPDDVRFEMLEAGPHIAPEFDQTLAEYAERTLAARGVKIRNNIRADRIENHAVYLPGGESIPSETIIVATGVAPSPLIAKLPVEKDHKGHAMTEPTMRLKGRSDIWALGDCASIPGPDGKPYPPLAQHALREARLLGDNLAAHLRGGALKPFVYHSKGTLAALGHFKGAGIVYGVNIHGFIAWWVWRTYYLFQMPGWSRRLRLVLDWTVALFFRNDIVQLDLRSDDSAN